jgi:hypothetical protein
MVVVKELEGTYRTFLTALWYSLDLNLSQGSNCCARTPVGMRLPFFNIISVTRYSLDSSDVVVRSRRISSMSPPGKTSWSVWRDWFRNATLASRVVASETGVGDLLSGALLDRNMMLDSIVHV